MRRMDRAVTDPERVRQLLEECRVCRLGLWDGREVYIVPMNYGYTFEDGRLTCISTVPRRGGSWISWRKGLP